MRAGSGANSRSATRARAALAFGVGPANALVDAVVQLASGGAECFDAHGVPAAAAEAVAFSPLGRNALHGLPNHLPRTMGAEGPRLLGELAPGADGSPFGKLPAPRDT